jgi:hypothetical protein
MKVTKVTYQKIFPIGMYLNEKIGVEIDIDDTESPHQALSKAKEIVEQFHKDSNPTVINEVGEQPLLIIEKEKLSQEDAIIRDIGTCTEIKILESYSMLAKKNQKIQDAYNKKYSDLLTP